MKKLFFLICFLFLEANVFGQWFFLDSIPGPDLYSCYFINSNIGYAVGLGGNIRKTTNGGINWVDQCVTTCSLWSVFFTDSLTGYVVGDSCQFSTKIYKTIDGGTNWNSILSPTSNGLRSVIFPVADTGYVVGLNGTILKTVNAGTNWILQNSGVKSNLRSVFFTDSKTGYIVGESDTILKTINGGANWISYISGTLSNTSVFFSSSDTGWVVGANSIIKTTNGGINWTPQIPPYPPPMLTGFLSVYFLNSNIGYITGGKYGVWACILKTVDGGSNWTLQIKPSHESFWSIFFPSIDTGYAVGTLGKIVKTTNGGIITLIELKDETQTCVIYPNPTINILNIETTQNSEIEISNISGQIIKKIDNYNANLTIDISDFAEGVYIIKVISSDLILTKKIIKY
jgi:photosystem II stability/assembly factor-like uncharacterized protein